MATNGADVIAYKDNVKYVIQVKFYSNPVGNKAVQEVVASIGMYKADKGMVVTNSTFTSSAVELANVNNVELVDGNKIEELKKEIVNNINRNNTNKSELELYIDDIFERANIMIQDIDKSDEQAFRKMLASFGLAYAVTEGEDFYNVEKIQKFMSGFFKYGEIEINEEQLDLKENKEEIETLVKAGICSVYINNNIMQPILEDNFLDDNKKMEIINNKINEYINNDFDKMERASKVFALKIFYKFSFDFEDNEEVNNDEEFYLENTFDNNILDSYDDIDYDDDNDYDDDFNY